MLFGVHFCCLFIVVLFNIGGKKMDCEEYFGVPIGVPNVNCIYNNDVAFGIVYGSYIS